MTIVALLNRAAAMASTTEVPIDNANMLERLDAIKESVDSITSRLVHSPILMPPRVKMIDFELVKPAIDGAIQSLEPFEQSNMASESETRLSALHREACSAQVALDSALRKAQRIYMDALIAAVKVDRRELEHRALADSPAMHALSALSSLENRARNEALLDESDITAFEKDLAKAKAIIASLPPHSEVKWENVEAVTQVVYGTGLTLGEISESDLLNLKHLRPDLTIRSPSSTA